MRSRKAEVEAEARVQEDTMASTHDVPNGSTPAELSEPGELNMSPSDLRSLVNRKRLRQYPSSKDDSEEPEPPENFSGDPEPPENFSDDVGCSEPPKKRRNKQKFSSEEINVIASVTRETLLASGHAGDCLNIQMNKEFWTWFIEHHGMEDVTWIQAKNYLYIY